MADEFRNGRLRLDCFLRIIDQFPSPPSRFKRLTQNTDAGENNTSDARRADKVTTEIEDHGLAENETQQFSHNIEDTHTDGGYNIDNTPDTADNHQSHSHSDKLQPLSQGTDHVAGNGHRKRARKTKRRLPENQLAMVRTPTLGCGEQLDITAEHEQQIIDVDPIEDIHPQPFNGSSRGAETTKKVQIAALSKRQWKSVGIPSEPKLASKDPNVSTQRHSRKVHFDGFLESELQVSRKPPKRKRVRKPKPASTGRELALVSGSLPSPPSHVGISDRGRLPKIIEQPTFQHPIVYDMTTDSTAPNNRRSKSSEEPVFQYPIVYDMTTDNWAHDPDGFVERTGPLDVPNDSASTALAVEPADGVVYYQLSAITAPPRGGSDSGSEENQEAHRSLADWDD